MRPDLLLCMNLLIAALTAHADDPPKHQPGAATQAFIDRPVDELQWQHGVSFFGDFKYPPGFTHFDYVNPDAPKGGKLVRGSGVSWNSFTPYIIKGRSAPVNILGEMSLYDSLMWPSGDEVGVYYGNLAESIIEAQQLLAHSGWNISDGALRNAAGAPFEVKFLVSDAEAQAVLLPYQQQLRRLGISSEIRLLEAAQYFNLLRKGDYDAVFGSLGFSFPPAAEVRAYLHSSSQGIYNFARLASPVVDALSDRVMNADSRESLTAATRALDRVLFWQFYFVPARVIEPARVMMWNKFGQPSTVAPYVSGFPATWWRDEEKAQRVEQVLQR